ncbi:hypothetical protein E4P39_13125 [Blastococcus sp. CT_GayMR19]|uniref:hypothetical protein n=1 Tax=Blastococcus sp. CT_GayMR19 TaxID=2559608 RepID=UPI0010745D62|nr:hypothetical protein [Blastococcus sp. CT_GayMR19]TFV74423.1 hypothetical protein E4P39_13125 [Blastococcus sp. CT_GayMR19]
MTKPSLAEVPIRSAAELTDRWATVLDPPIFGARSLWLMWLGTDGLVLPIIVPVDDLPPLPDQALAAGLLQVHAGVVADHLGGEGHLALALCRPGRPQASSDDERWAAGLRAAFDDGLDGTWSLHLAAGGRVSQLVAPPIRIWARG